MCIYIYTCVSLNMRLTDFEANSGLIKVNLHFS